MSTRQTLIGIALAVLALPAQAGAQGTLDANCSAPPEAAEGSIGNARWAQTFTAQTTGTLTRAEVRISKFGTSADWVLQITDVDAVGVPTGNALASTTIPDATVPAGVSTLSGTFASPVTVAAGQTYALLITRPGSTELELRLNVNDCPGVLYRNTLPSGGTFTPFIDGTYDMIFAVFVEPQAPDTDLPETTITAEPKDKTRKRTASFEFISDEAGSTFSCSLDGGAFVPCASPYTVKVKKGRHSFAVQAVDQAGNVDGSPATDDWKVKKKKK